MSGYYPDVAARKVTRIVFEVRYSRSEKLWTIKRRDISGGVLAYERTRDAAVKRGAKEARALGTLAQVVVYTKRGTISFERTYPRSSDPRRSKG